MLLGLVFRESAKSKRSIRAWREEGKGVFDVISPPQAGTKSIFGRQGEKKAGFILQRLEETLPRYASPTHPFLATTPMPEPASMPAPTTQSNPKRPATRPKSHSAVDSAVSAGRNLSRPPQDV
ncbi:hypothetical protein VKT23_010970 [Stygiomarasmius scandens]|uniref:Uncharacterized protein n=1 Tax=Marasmiellus scandens TaxID=2682957 RepID=A0ABR1JAF4_9AGAR